MHREWIRFFVSLVILAGISAAIFGLGTSSTGKVLAQTYPSSTPSSGFFEGLPNAARGFFEDLQQQFDSWFYGGPMEHQGGGELYHPAEAMVTPPTGVTPTPGPYLNLGDMIQLDASISSNCIRDKAPDELHEATNNRDENCDWTIPEAVENEFVSDVSECDGHWQTLPITCLTNYADNQGYVQSNPGGCMGTSQLSVCAIKVYDPDPGGSGNKYYHLHWKLEFQNDIINPHQSGERAGDYLLGRGRIAETHLFGLHRDHTGDLTDISGWQESPEYFWPRPERSLGSGDYAWCTWQTGMPSGAVAAIPGVTLTESDCGCGGGSLCNLFPHEFAESENGEGLIAFQSKGSCDGGEGGCYWDDYFGRTDVPSEYTVINIANLASAIDQTAYNEAPDAGNDFESAIPCDFPEMTDYSCQGCDDTQPDGLDDFLGICVFLPGQGECPSIYNTPNNTFGECPTTGCDHAPTDLCWGLYDPALGQYAPVSDPGATGPCAGVNPWAAAELAQGGAWECRYQVPAVNLRKYIGEECNQIESLPRHYRYCSSTYAPVTIPEGISLDYLAYVRKLNGCNAHFYGEQILETGPQSGIAPPDSPPLHENYCQNVGSDVRLDSGEMVNTGDICNSTDGMRCVDLNSTSNVCRKAISVETFETSYRTTEAPPGDAFTANCLKRVGPGETINCVDHNCSLTNLYCPCPPADDGTGNLVCDDMSSPGTDCSGDGIDDCCCDCEDSDPVDGCTGVTENACHYPDTGTTCSSTWISDPCATPLCADAEECCRVKSHCLGPQPPRGIDNQFDSGINSARNCAVYEYTRRENIYTVIYDSNAINMSLSVKNLSQHPVPARPFNLELLEQWLADQGLTLPLEPSQYDPQNPPDGNDPLSLITIETQLPDFVDLNNYRIIYSDRTPTNPDKTPLLLVAQLPPNHSHGGRIELTFSPLPAANDLENGNSQFSISLTIIPSQVDANGDDLPNNGSFRDYTLSDRSELDHFINSLPSDDRLANLEFNAKWANTRSVELLSFWTGQGVLGTASPCAYGGTPCFTDAEALPYGWPNLGVITQDWGGIEGAETFTGETIVNPLADIYGPRYETQGMSGVYRLCDGQWINAGIDIAPSGEATWSPSIFSTHAGYITHAGPHPSYPGRGEYVEIQSTIDDDCHPNFLTRYGNLAKGSIRVQRGEYVPRHKLLGLMGDSGTPGYVHVHYTVNSEQPNKELSDTDIPDNNVGEDMITCDVDPYIDPPTSDYLKLEGLRDIEPDDLHDISGDSCTNPYQCYEPNLCHPDPNASPSDVCHFCTIRRAGDEVKSCYYANP